MKPVSCYASQPHYVDHLAPVWLELDPAERGNFYCGSRHTLQRAAHLGLNPVLRTTLLYPHGRRTLIGKHQPHVLVGSLADYTATERARCVWLEHGIGQYFVDDPVEGARPPNGGRSRMDLFLMPGAASGDLFRSAYPLRPVIDVGCPKLDDMSRDGIRTDVTPTIGVTFHWQPAKCCPERGTAYAHWAAALPELCRRAEQQGWRILGHAHPKAWQLFRPLWERMGVQVVDQLDELLELSDVLISDGVSALYEMAAAGRPVVVLNAPWFRRDVEHGLRFWAEAGIGQHCDSGSAAELEEAITAAVREPCTRSDVLTRVYTALDQRSASRAVAAMREHLP